MSNIKIMDVSLRDGGYLNNWRFEADQLKKAALLLDSLMIDYIELGYINDELSLGMADKSALRVLEEIAGRARHAGFAMMINPKFQNVKHRLCHFADYISYIRVPCDFTNIAAAMKLAEYIKRNNIKVSFNLISITQYSHQELIDFIQSFQGSGLFDLLYVADSRGSLKPHQVSEIIQTLQIHFYCPLGFHAHDNLGRAIANTLASIEAGCHWVDGSVSGYGLGGGNTSMETLLQCLKGPDIGNEAMKNLFHQLIQTLDLAKPGAFEMELYRHSAEKNLEQEWVPIVYEKYGMDAPAIINALPFQNYKNNDDILEFIIKNREGPHANQRIATG